MRARQPELARIRRCPSCCLHRSLCICALIPTIATRTRVVLVIHQLELNKPTNTGRLAVRCLPNSELLVRGLSKEALPAAREPAWIAGPRLLLYPHADAQPIERWRDSEEPLTLVVPDGTWRQAARARRRVPGLADVPCVALPSVVSGYRLRQATRPGRLSTLEAIARALEILEGPAVSEQLEHIHRVMIDRTLWTNGRLATEAVTGGIPPGVQSHDPLSGVTVRSGETGSS
jgi:DTW domain-containing protein YfiP